MEGLGGCAFTGLSCLRSETRGTELRRFIYLGICLGFASRVVQSAQSHAFSGHWPSVHCACPAFEGKLPLDYLGEELLDCASDAWLKPAI